LQQNEIGAEAAWPINIRQALSPSEPRLSPVVLFDHFKPSQL
jgi:hypothetical protein